MSRQGDSWQLISNTMNGTSTTPVHLSTVNDVKRALHPLQAEADRLGRQVESFAESLDRFSNGGKHNDETPLLSSLRMVNAFRGIAQDTVDQLTRKGQTDLRRSTRNLSKSLKKSGYASAGLAASLRDVVDVRPEDIKAWEAEKQTWDLLYTLLQVRAKEEFNSTGLLDLLEPPRQGIQLHRYSTESDLFEAFLATAKGAWEKHTILNWLKSCAHESRPDIEDIVSAQGEQHLWSHGWLHTKEALKAQKRLRSLHGPIGPQDAVGKLESKRENGSKPLVTQLDPDSLTRQTRSLEIKDEDIEHTTWRSFWEMLRRGYSWLEVRDWCEERNETIRCATLQNWPEIFQLGKNGSPAARRHRAVWRKACQALANQQSLDKYQRAVFGVLSGDLDSVLPVCESWEDRLFARLNASLINDFDVFAKTKTDEYYSRAESLEDIVKASVSETSKDDFVASMSRVQAYLMSTDFRKENGTILTSTPSLEDHNYLRLITHLALSSRLGATLDNEVESIVAKYAEFLGKAGKLQLLPLYASRLDEKKAVETMARQLPFIVEESDRVTVLNLMQSYKLDIPHILDKQLTLLTKGDDTSCTGSSTSFEILDKAVDEWPAIKENIIGDEISGVDSDFVHGFEWFLLVDGLWEETMAAGVLCYKHFLQTNRLAAGVELSRRVPFSTISLTKTGTLLGQELDIASPSLQATTSNTPTLALLSSSKTFRDMESLFVVLDLFQTWRTLISSTPTSSRSDSAQARPWRVSLSDLHQQITASITPLLHTWLLDTDLSSLRKIYIPEILLSYIQIIDFNGHYLSRDVLLQSMDLAVSIAAQDSDLIAPFFEAGRMSELVDALARASKSILRADEVGKKKGKALKAGKGETLSVWTVATS